MLLFMDYSLGICLNLYFLNTSKPFPYVYRNLTVWCFDRVGRRREDQRARNQKKVASGSCGGGKVSLKVTLTSNPSLPSKCLFNSQNLQEKTIFRLFRFHIFFCNFSILEAAPFIIVLKFSAEEFKVLPQTSGTHHQRTRRRCCM
ncbi:Ubiquitin-fold modifier 1 like [Actinidia chinensis var. chinensis]|uniref:Ubiquitin-fold modifier 1 like n=1 Tax=Actinidia chinensis var. chinensis TaxID=1590841 RepID=A0A2R6QYT6_ACTCC|nr:Ubiquitin-fold modifier 1 like [Actinidia chinensis var. chinensis]